MSRRANTQYTAGGTDFDVVLGNDPYLKKDTQGVQAALEGHDHTATKGLPVGRIGTAVVGTAQLIALSVDSSILAANAVTTLKILDGAVTTAKIAAGGATGAALGADVVKTTGVQSISGPKTLDSAVLSNITTVDGAIREDRGVDVPSLTTTTLGDDGNSFLITGTTNITSITVKPAGTVVRLIFNGVLTLVDGAGTLHLAGDFVTASESTITLLSMGTYWQELGRVDQNVIGAKIVSGTYTGNGSASRTIALVFNPKLVFIQHGSKDGFWSLINSAANTAFAFTDAGNVIAGDEKGNLTTNGFVVGTPNNAGSDADMNANGVVYTYVALG